MPAKHRRTKTPTSRKALRAHPPHELVERLKRERDEAVDGGRRYGGQAAVHWYPSQQINPQLCSRDDRGTYQTGHAFGEVLHITSTKQACRILVFDRH